MNQVTTKVILLKRIEYGEADRILTALTPDHGKITLLAKGVRRSKSKLAGGLELFSTTDVTYIDGKSDMKTVIGTKLDHHYKHIVEDVSKTMIAYEFLKKIHAHTEEHAEREYYELLEHALAALDGKAVDKALVEAWFHMQLLSISGHGINIEQDVEGRSFDVTSMYSFQYDDMGFSRNDSGAFGPNHIKLLRLLQKVHTPEALLRVKDSSTLIDQLLPLLRRCAA